jgi:hypothetical protein
MKLHEFLARMEADLSAQNDAEKRLELMAKALRQAFGVKSDEVGIFAYFPDHRTLEFLWPVPLRPMGSIPLSSTVSLVARTAREKVPRLNNSFALTPHTTVFENIPQEGVAPTERIIQRIMSVPMMAGEELRGVIQVSRKGASRDTAGKDFTPPELTALEKLAGVFARFI